MLFNLIFFILFVTVAFFHYTQGLFSATLSAILSVVAAVVAVSYHEWAAAYLIKMMPDQAYAVALVVLFVIAYLIPRLILDNFVPGNVRFPVLMDKIGAGAMGVVAGLFSTGLFALAAQTMPFGPAVGGFSRQELIDRPNIIVAGDSGGHTMDSQTTEELAGDYLGDPVHARGMWLHQDELVVGFVRGVSGAGSGLANDRPLDQMHPDYLTELLGQRLGSPIGTKRVASGGVGLVAAYKPAKLAPAMMIDTELKSVRTEQPLPEVAVADATLVVLRVSFANSPDLIDAADHLLRFSPANVRLKAGAHDLYPIGTLVGGAVLLRNRVDDPMFIDVKAGEQRVDFVFAVANDDLNVKTEGKDRTVSFKPGSYLEVKWSIRIDLSGRGLDAPPTDDTMPVSKDFEETNILGGVVRKRSVGEAVFAKLATIIPGTQKSAATQPAQSHDGSKPAAPANGKQDNELLPPTAGQTLGL